MTGSAPFRSCLSGVDAELFPEADDTPGAAWAVASDRWAALEFAEDTAGVVRLIELVPTEAPDD